MILNFSLRFLSLEYRSALRSALCSLGEEDSELRETIGLYELIWSLTEAIFINSHGWFLSLVILI